MFFLFFLKWTPEKTLVRMKVSSSSSCVREAESIVMDRRWSCRLWERHVCVLFVLATPTQITPLGAIHYLLRLLKFPALSPARCFPSGAVTRDERERERERELVFQPSFGNCPHRHLCFAFFFPLSLFWTPHLMRRPLPMQGSTPFSWGVPRDAALQPLPGALREL